MKPWHQNYPNNVAHQLNTEQFSSLAELFTHTVESYQDHSAYVNFGAELSFNQLDAFSNDFAAYLQQSLGLKKGDRVALMCPNTLPFVVAMWGIIKSGAIQVSVNPLYTPRELKHQLNDADVDTVVIFSGSTPVLAEIINETKVKNVIVTKLDDMVGKGLPNADVDQRLGDCLAFEQVLTQGKNLDFTPPTLTQDDLVLLQYTGGTTGLSKGAMLTHGNIIANVLQFREITQNSLTAGNELIVTAIPMYHIFALAVNCISFFTTGAKNVLITNPRDMPSFVKTWSGYQVTAFTGVNTLFNGLLHTEGFAAVDFSKLKLVIGGGAPVQQAVADKWQQVTGTQLKEGYGLSETSPVVSLNLGKDDLYVQGIGVPLPSTDISIRDDQGKVLTDGETGELCVKGPQVMPGYWNNQDATAEVMTEDGYFKTGDIAFLDERGFFHIVDRKKDMILVSGFNVYPNEIEGEIAKMPQILECACIGVPDDATGEAVKVFAVKSDPNVSAADVTEFCRNNLAAYKVPKQIEFIDEIPKSTVGKILRRELRG